MANHRRKRSRRNPKCAHRDYIPKRNVGNDISRRVHRDRRNVRDGDGLVAEPGWLERAG